MSLEDFTASASAAALEPGDLRTPVITFAPTGNGARTVDFELKTAAFSRQDAPRPTGLTAEMVTVQPNPAPAGVFTLTFASEAARSLQPVASDALGRTVWSQPSRHQPASTPFGWT